MSSPDATWNLTNKGRVVIELCDHVIADAEPLLKVPPSLQE
jgi:hypothetical protein